MRGRFIISFHNETPRACPGGKIPSQLQKGEILE